MKVLFIARASLYKVYGGDTVQIVSTAKYLRKAGVEVDIKLDNETIDYTPYDLLHVFNIIRPATILPHLLRSKKPYVVSTIFVDYTEYEQYHRKGVAATITNRLSTDAAEYIKTWARWVKNGDTFPGKKYLLNGHKKTVQQVAAGAALLLPNSESEYIRFVAAYKIKPPYRVIYNGVDPEIFALNPDATHDPKEVLCVARIEGKKNQLNLIKALNNTAYHLTLVGDPAPNHVSYYNACKQIAASNISFQKFLPQESLLPFYRNAKVHVLPSWNETCGLSSLEAAYLGCNIVITDRGDTSEYYGDNAWYCNPADPSSIYEAVEKASISMHNNILKQKVATLYNWEKAAEHTVLAYENVLNKKIGVT